MRSCVAAIEAVRVGWPIVIGTGAARRQNDHDRGSICRTKAHLEKKILRT